MLASATPHLWSGKLIGAMAWLVASGEFDVVLGSRILGKGALAGGMPVYKYISNRLLTADAASYTQANFADINSASPSHRYATSGPPLATL